MAATRDDERGHDMEKSLHAHIKNPALLPGFSTLCR
jgi:hypothetical protein